MSKTPSLPPPMTTARLEALVGAASIDELRRALRLVLGSEQAYWERDLTSGHTWYSPRFFQILGLPQTHERELINSRIHRDDQAQFEAAYSAALRSGGTFSYDVRYRDANEQYRWARAFGRVWLDERDRQPLRLIGTISDVHAERQARLDVDAYARRYQRALDAASEAHFERTAGLDDFSVSDNLAQLLGHPPGTPPPDRHTFVGWVHPEDLPKLNAEIARAWTAAGTWAATYRLRMADGGWRWFRGRGRTEPDSAGRMRMSGMVGDVQQQELDRQELDDHRHRLRAMVAERTEALNAALAEAQRQREQAERASSAKSEFLAHMSHELRTPLNGLLGLTELALKGAEEAAQRRYLEVALSSGRALLQLINEVLDLSRLDAGGIELAHQTFDLSELLADVMRSLMPGAPGAAHDGGARAVSMRYDWLGEITEVQGDAARVRQVVTNLAANAIKFTERGHVALRAELVADGAGGARATVRLEDTGPGIDDAQRERVFEAFVQADASLTRQHGGSGLGLAIARRLARAMGGDVTLERSGPEGSSFTFTWPVQLAPEPLALPPVPPGLAWVVYQRADSAQWFSRRLARLGWRSEHIGTLDDLIARAKQTPAAQLPAVVAVGELSIDPRIDFAALRAALPRAHIALLVRPDWDQPTVERAALAQGAKTIVAPITPRALGAMLSAQPANAAPGAAAVALAPAVSAAHVLIVEDNAVNLMITEEFVRQLGHEPSGAIDGAAAIAACQRQAPQLVLMDLQMPVMDGLETTRRLRALQDEGRLPRFPIIALTAHASDADRKLSAAAGMDDYLTKPILIDALRSAFERWLK